VQQYVWDIDQEDKEELIELARFRFYDAADFYQTVPIGRSSLNEHLNAESSAIDLEVARPLLDITRSEPVYSLEDPFTEEKIRDKSTWKGEERLQLEENYKDFLLKPYKRKELEELTDYSTDQVNNYLRSGRKVPRDFYEKIVEDTRQRVEEDVSPEGDICVKDAHSMNEWSEGVLIEDAGPKEVRSVTDFLTSIEDPEPEDVIRLNFSESINDLSLQERGYLRSYGQEAFSNIDEALEDPCRNSLTPERRVSHVYSVLEGMRLLERTGSKSVYALNTDREEFQLLKEELEKNNLGVEEPTSGEDSASRSDSLEDSSVELRFEEDLRTLETKHN